MDIKVVKETLIKKVMWFTGGKIPKFKVIIGPNLIVLLIWIMLLVVEIFLETDSFIKYNVAGLNMHMLAGPQPSS